MTLVFDIDNTVLFSEFVDGKYYLQASNKELVAAVNYLFEMGSTIIMYTARHWNHFMVTKEQLQEIGIKYHSLVMGKPVADFYIDDRATKPEEFLKLVKTLYGGKNNGK